MKKKLTGSAHHWHPAVRTQFLHCLCVKHLSIGSPRAISPMNTHSIWMIRCMSVTEPYATCYALYLSRTHSHIISRTGNFTSLSTEGFNIRFYFKIYGERKGILKNKDKWIGVKKLANRKRTVEEKGTKHKWKKER